MHSELEEPVFGLKKRMMHGVLDAHIAHYGQTGGTPNEYNI